MPRPPEIMPSDLAHYPLCPVTALSGEDAQGFWLQTPDGPRGVLLLRREGRLYAYLNRCPHTGVNLDWITGQFLDGSGHYIQCATHGALFRPADGYCVHGPCAGQSLQALPLYRDGERVGVLL